jgi:hypothetical protein
MDLFLHPSRPDVATWCVRTVNATKPKACVVRGFTAAHGMHAREKEGWVNGRACSLYLVLRDI